MITHNMYICTKTFCVRIRVCMYVVQNEKEKEIVILSYVYIHAEHTHQWIKIFNNIMILLDVSVTLHKLWSCNLKLQYFCELKHFSSLGYH